MSDEKILARVRKMLALANDQAASEHERDTALQMSYNLLAKHNLTMVDAADPLPEDREEYRMETFGMHWCRSVCGNIADLFFCNYFFGSKLNATKMRHHFVGKESNATTAMLLSTFVIDSILKECRSLYKHNLAPESRSFAIGASDRLRSRIYKMKADATTKDSEPGTALMLISLYDSEKAENDKRLSQLGIELYTPKRGGSNNVHTDAYNKGREFADGINLSPQISDHRKLRIN